MPPTRFSLPEVGVGFALLPLIGGIGTIRGPPLGAAVLIPLANYLRITLGGLPGAHRVILGLLLMLGALFPRRGIAGALASRRRWGPRAPPRAPRPPPAPPTPRRAHAAHARNAPDASPATHGLRGRCASAPMMFDIRNEMTFVRRRYAATIRFTG
jgi:hypothetical protein